MHTASSGHVIRDRFLCCCAVLAVTIAERLEFVAFGRFGSEPIFPLNGSVPLHRYLFLSGHMVLSLTKQSASALISHQFSKQSYIFMLGKK